MDKQIMRYVTGLKDEFVPGFMNDFKETQTIGHTVFGEKDITYEIKQNKLKKYFFNSYVDSFKSSWSIYIFFGIILSISIPYQYLWHISIWLSFIPFLVFLIPFIIVYVHAKTPRLWINGEMYMELPTFIQAIKLIMLIRYVRKKEKQKTKEMRIKTALIELEKAYDKK